MALFFQTENNVRKITNPEDQARILANPELLRHALIDPDVSEVQGKYHPHYWKADRERNRFVPMDAAERRRIDEDHRIRGALNDVRPWGKAPRLSAARRVASRVSPRRASIAPLIFGAIAGAMIAILALRLLG